MTALIAALVVGIPAADLHAAGADSPTAKISQGGELRVEQIEIGFDGLYKVGVWTPLRMTLTARTATTVTLVIEAPDPDDDLALLPNEPWSLPAGTPRRFETVFKTARINGDLHLRFQDATGQTVLARNLHPGTEPGAVLRPGLALDEVVRATLGNPAGFSAGPLGQAVADQEHSPSKAEAVDSSATSTALIVHLDSPARLPEQWRGYQALNTLVIAAGRKEGDRPAVLNQLTPAQDRALREWVQMGGHLVLSVGSDVDSYKQCLPAKWVPVAVTGQTQLRQLHGLESFSGRNAPLMFPGTVPGAKIGNFDGVVLAQEVGGPLLVRVPFGFGRITFLGMDLDRPPLSNWASLPWACERLVEDGRGESRRHSRQQKQLAHLGVSDLASQLHATLEDFNGLHRFSYWSVMGLLLLYVAVIGPLDYFVVTRWLRKPELTWLTFPLFVGLAAALSISAANSANGDRLQVNQFDLVDIDANQKILRGQSWFTLCSPEARRYAVSVEPVNDLASGSPVRISWMGIPENKVGGLYRSGGLNVSGKSYAFGTSAGSIENVPIQKWSTKSLIADWQVAADGLVESRLEGAGVGRLSGSIQHRLPVDLEECMLVHGGRVYFPRKGIRSLAPHQEWEPGGPQGQQRELKAFLTGTVALRQEKMNSGRPETEIVFKTEPYNAMHRAPGALARMLSFHHSAGGHVYTGLDHAALRELEFSPLAELGRAVLLGRVKSAASRVRVGGEVREPVSRATFVRFVLPVHQLNPADTHPMPNLNEETKGFK